MSNRHYIRVNHEVSFIKLHSLLPQPFPHFTAWQYLEEKWTTFPPNESGCVSQTSCYTITTEKRHERARKHKINSCFFPFK